MWAFSGSASLVKVCSLTYIVFLALLFCSEKYNRNVNAFIVNNHNRARSSSGGRLHSHLSPVNKLNYQPSYSNFRSNTNVNVNKYNLNEPSSSMIKLYAKKGGDSDQGGGYAETPQYSAPPASEDPRLGPPPDLPSLLLHNRIVYIGMALVPAVTELIIAELLYLNYESQEKPIYLYINSPGLSSPDGRAMGFDTEAFAVADVMKYIKAPVATVCVGQCFGAAAMLLASGAKGQRYSLPNGSMMLHQPKSLSRGQASDIAIKAREVMRNRKIMCEMLAKGCGKPVEEIIDVASRKTYFSPEEAVEFGLIDQILHSSKELPVGILPAQVNPPPQTF